MRTVDLLRCTDVPGRALRGTRAYSNKLNRRTVLHYDGDFDMIASLTGQPTEWVVPPGSADR